LNYVIDFISFVFAEVYMMIWFHQKLTFDCIFKLKMWKSHHVYLGQFIFFLAILLNLKRLLVIIKWLLLMMKLFNCNFSWWIWVSIFFMSAWGCFLAISDCFFIIFKAADIFLGVHSFRISSLCLTSFWYF
jgi:hypothetical protein